MITYGQASQLTRSEKVTLVTMEAVERVKLFTSTGADWSRVVSYFVVGVKDGDTIINDWDFSPTTMTLKIIGGVNPINRNIILVYRFFFSNAPLILPYDLDSGAAVEWQPYVSSTGSIGQQLDDENTGIVLESSSSIDFINSDGYFDSIYDKLIWENQSVKIYSWFPSIPINEHVQLFDGALDSKSFSESKVQFKVKDFVFKLKNVLNLGSFSNTDGIILPSLLDTPKRRIYGQVDNVKCISLDATLQGYLITGLLTISFGSQTLTGSGTSFLSELSVEDEIITEFNGEEVKFGIQSIESNTSLTIGKISEFNFVSKAMSVSPKISYRGKNRTWHVAGHQLRSPSASIILSVTNNAFLLYEPKDFFNDDEIVINGQQARIRRMSGDNLITNSTIIPTPVFGDVVYKRPVQKVFFEKRELVYGRDYTIENYAEAKIIIDPLAEFNSFPQRLLGVNLTMTNGSRTMTTSSVVDFRSILYPRDWIRSSNIGEADWYEILQVKEQQLILRTPFLGATATKAALIKNVEYINENSLITVSCLGMEYEYKWVKTASDAVRHLVKNDAGFTSVNEDSFEKANSDCDYILSMVIPEKVGEKAPLIRDVITKINESVFGSLYGDNSQNISYSILNATKPELKNIIRDDDILGFSISSKQQIINKAIVKYRPFVDIANGADAFLFEEHNSNLVNQLIGIKNTTEKTVYLYETDKAKIIAQRIVLMNSLSSASVVIKGKLNLSKVVVNDKIFLSLDRLYGRFGSGDKRKLGTVTGVRKDGYNCEVTVSDLSNIYNRVPSIAPNGAVDFSVADADDVLRWGYVLNNDTETPDANSERCLGANIIG